MICMNLIEIYPTAKNSSGNLTYLEFNEPHLTVKKCFVSCKDFDLKKWITKGIKLW